MYWSNSMQVSTQPPEGSHHWTAGTTVKARGHAYVKAGIIPETAGSMMGIMDGSAYSGACSSALTKLNRKVHQDIIIW